MIQQLCQVVFRFQYLRCLVGAEFVCFLNYKVPRCFIWLLEEITLLAKKTDTRERK
jgi:hypothetical protein